MTDENRPMADAASSGRVPDGRPGSAARVAGGPRPSRWWWVAFVFARLRFVMILGVLGLVIVKWDTLHGWYAKWTRPAGSGNAAVADTEFYCPMHPTVVRDTNKEKCPICFMPLSKRKKGDGTDEVLPAGVVSRLQLTPYRVVLAGVQTFPVAYQPLAKHIVTVGTVEFDERGLRQVAARVKGRIDTLLVNQTGQTVQKGDELARLYSPDLVVTAQNLVDANAAGSADMVQIARERLKLWGIADDQLDEVVKTGKRITHLSIRSPISGHVLRKYVREGQYVEEGTALYDVADLSTVWVQAQLYEEDLAFLPEGTHDNKTGLPEDRLPVMATARGLPGRTFVGALSFVYPHVDPESRTLTVRFTLPNPKHDLRPGMSATVSLRITPDLFPRLPSGARLRRDGDKVLAVPEGCVIDTGAQKLVYRQELPGVFDGVLVELGPRMDGPDGVPFYPVLRGVEPGDLVVSSGSFLIDAETRLNPAAGSIYLGGGGGKGGTAPGPTIRPTTPEDQDSKVKLALAKLDPADRALAEAQQTCPVLKGSRLGSMGAPLKLSLEGKAVFVCCKICIQEAQESPAETVALAEKLQEKSKAVAEPGEEAVIREKLARLPPADRKLAEAQLLCPVTGERLGSMGVPPKLAVGGRPFFTCCKGCNEEALADPPVTLKKLDEGKKKLAPTKK